MKYKVHITSDIFIDKKISEEKTAKIKNTIIESMIRNNFYNIEVAINPAESKDNWPTSEEYTFKFNDCEIPEEMIDDIIKSVLTYLPKENMLH